MGNKRGLTIVWSILILCLLASTVFNTVWGQDTTPPQVMDSSPVGAGVEVTTNIAINFSEEMNHTETEDSFSITPLVSGAFLWRGVLIFTPSSDLLYDTTYTVSLDANSARDLEGNLLDGNGNCVAEGSPTDDYSWQFTTQSSNAAPKVVTHDPIGTDVPVASSISFDFDGLMNHTSLEIAFSISPPVTGAFIINDNTITTMVFDPDTDFSYSIPYTVLLTGNVAKDVTGNYLDGNGNGVSEGSPIDDFTWTFTAESPDITPPQVIDNTPVSSSTSITSHITVIFDEKMNETATKQAFNITPFVPGVFQIDDEPGEWLLAFHPSDNLQLSTAYTVTVNSDTAMDTAGNLLDGNGDGAAEGSPTDDFIWTFTTENADLTPPTVAAYSPADSTVPTDTEIDIAFSELMDLTATESGFSIDPTVSGQFTLVDTLGCTNLRFDPDTPLPFDTTYTVTLDGDVASDRSGNTLDGNGNGVSDGGPADDVSWQFTTELDNVPPDPITDLTASPGTNDGDITLQWTAPGNDGDTGTAGMYDVRYSTGLVTADDWASMTEATGEPVPALAGTSQTMAITDLAPGLQYHFAIKTSDGIPNTSPISNIANATTTNLDPPQALSNLTIGQSNDGIQISWALSVDLDVDHYVIYRSEDNTTFDAIANVSADLDTFTDNNAEAGVQYYYKVMAVDTAGHESPASGVLMMILPASDGASPDTTTDEGPNIGYIMVVIGVVAVIFLAGIMVIKKPWVKSPNANEKESDEN